MTAIGSPGGGTYSWTVSGGTAQLVDSAGTPTTTGPTVYLRAFRADDATGNIPAQAATVGVTYTHPNGTATDNKNVPIHKIEFVVTNTTITAGVTQANETAATAELGGAPGVATMSTDPRVEIQLDASCPRKAACAANHQVGWLQTMLSNDRQIRYRHTLITVPVAMPIRDIIAGPFPFYSTVTPFTADRNRQTAHHEDSPSVTCPWTDPRGASPAPPPPVNKTLRTISCGNSFTAWLVVQNIEWSAHDVDNSFAFVRHFNWSMQLNVTVNVTLAIGSRCTPASNPATIGALQVGKGGSSPVLTAPVYNTVANASITIAAAGPI
ncbi:MAG: hypothetical protein WA584_10955 [Pyrinomonadaceae bacterium]